MDGRDIGEQSDAVLRTTMPGHDKSLGVAGFARQHAEIDADLA